MANSQKCIDINTASADDLQTLPGIGRGRAEAIVKARMKIGYFESVDDLRKVTGMSLLVIQRNASNLICHKRRVHATSSSKGVRHTDNSSRVTRSVTAAKATKCRRPGAANVSSSTSHCPPYWMRHMRPTNAAKGNSASATCVTAPDGVSVASCDQVLPHFAAGGSDRSAASSTSQPMCGCGAATAPFCPHMNRMQIDDGVGRHAGQLVPSVFNCAKSFDGRKQVIPEGSLESECSAVKSADGLCTAAGRGQTRHCRQHRGTDGQCSLCTVNAADYTVFLNPPSDCSQPSWTRMTGAHADRPWMKLVEHDSHHYCQSEMLHSDGDTARCSHDASKSPVYRKQRIPSRNNPPPMMSQWLTTFQHWSHAERLLALDELVDLCDATQVRHVMQVIEPQFQRDFISLLPKELALYVLSYLEPRDLARASQTCHYWHVLAEDNLLWREKCREEGVTDAGVSARMTRRRPPSRITPIPAHMTWKNVYRRQKMIENNWSRAELLPPKVLKGHDDHVITCLEFCGNKIVSGSDDNTLKVWSAVNGKCLRTLVGHTGGVWSSQMSANTIISGSTDRTVKVWNADTGQCAFTLYGHTSTVRCMHLHETRLVSGSRDATLRVWDIVSGHCLHVLIGHVAAVRCVQYDGRRVVSGAYDYMVKIWDAESETCLQTLSGHTNRVYSLQFDGVHIVSGSLDTSIRVWSAETGACLHTLIGHQSLTSGMELRDNILVSGNADSTVKVWNITTGQCLQTLQGANKHQSAVTCLQFNRRFVVTSSDDGTVKIWDLRTGEFLRNLVALDSGGSGGVVWRIRCSNNKLVCAVGSRNGTEETKLLVLDFDVNEDQLGSSQC